MIGNLGGRISPTLLTQFFKRGSPIRSLGSALCVLGVFVVTTKVIGKHSGNQRSDPRNQRRFAADQSKVAAI